MNEATLQPARSRSSHVAPVVALRRTAAGQLTHSATSDHHISVLTSGPVRVSCHAGRVRSLRAPGEINLMPAGSSDEWTEDDASELVEVRLPQPLLAVAANDMGFDPARVGIEPRCHARDERIEHIVGALAADLRAGFSNGLLYRESLGLALAIHLLGRYRSSVAPRVGLGADKLRLVTEYIEAHLDRDVSLLRLARVTGVSASHLRAQFRRSMGVPVHEYVIQRRVQRARSLLQQGTLPTAQVALEAGFSHQSHMARCMRRVLGVTPAAVARARA